MAFPQIATAMPRTGSTRRSDVKPGTDPEWTLLLKEYPQLIRRPVVVTDDGTLTQGFSDNGFKKRFGIG